MSPFGWPASGCGSSLLSRVGADALGREVLDLLARARLDTTLIQVDPRHPTGTVTVDTTDPGRVRYDIVAPAAWDFIEVPPGPSPASAAVLVYGSLAARNEVSRRTLFHLDAAALRVFDVNLRSPFTARDVIETLLARADWAKVNAEELAEIAGWNNGTDEIETAARSVAERYGLRAICVTLGAEGAGLLHEGRWYRQPGFRVPVIDTIGCGDSFLAGWLARMLMGDLPDEALLWGAAVGALVAARPGANPEFDLAEVEDLIGR
ncbi:MAG: PfkB family carbohydrate kinase [Gemmatimonadales bacterium]